MWAAATTDQVATWRREEETAAERLTVLRQAQATAAEQARALRAQDAGVIRQWLILAAIRFEGAGATALDQEQVPQEFDLRPRAGERVTVEQSGWVWSAVQLEDYLLDFNQFMRDKTGSVVAYAICYILSDTTQTGLLMHVGSDDQAKVYLNGKEVHWHEEPRTYVPDQDVVAGVEFRVGLNVLVFKVLNVEVDWLGSIRFTDSTVRPIKGIRVTLDPDAKD